MRSQRGMATITQAARLGALAALLALALLPSPGLAEAGAQTNEAATGEEATADGNGQEGTGEGAQPDAGTGEAEQPDADASETAQPDGAEADAAGDSPGLSDITRDALTGGTGGPARLPAALAGPRRAYGQASGTSGTVSWTVDYHTGELHFKPTSGSSGTFEAAYGWPDWTAYKSDIKTVTSEGSLRGTGGMAYFFGWMSGATSITCAAGWDTAGVTDMTDVFCGCTNVTEVDISGWDTRSVTDAEGAFTTLHALKSIKLGPRFSFKGAGITDTTHMFCLPTPQLNGYTRKWIRSDGRYGPYTAEELRDSYTSAMAGTWLYQYVYTISYDSAGGSLVPNQTKLTAQPVTLTTTIPTRAGYTFKGWNNYGTMYAPGQTYTADAFLGLTAKWEANSYTVRFDPNGGSGSMDDQAFSYGTAQGLAANAFTRTGYAFAGWNTAADGSGQAYADRASVSNLTSEDGATVTLYAQWERANVVVTIPAQIAYEDMGVGPVSTSDSFDVTVSGNFTGRVTVASTAGALSDGAGETLMSSSLSASSPLVFDAAGTQRDSIAITGTAKSSSTWQGGVTYQVSLNW